MRIAVLVSSYELSESCLKGYDPQPNPAFHIQSDTYEFEVKKIDKANAYKQIRQLAIHGKYDLIVNLCDGADDEDRAGPEVVRALEKFNLPFTGATSAFYNITKEQMKMAAHSCGIIFPAHVFAFNESQIAQAISELQFPMIVKHHNGYSSVGMTKSSRVENESDLHSAVTKILDEFGGALIEEFIEGREFTVLVAENAKDPANPVTFQPLECVFSSGETFKHFELKWIEYDAITWQPVKNLELADRLKKSAATMFLAVNGSSYGRCDFRMNSEGKLFFLEINANCGIFYPKDEYGSADFILSTDSKGHQGFFDLICEAAVASHARKQSKCAVNYHRGNGFGVEAKSDIVPGEIIEIYEERSVNIVSKKHCEMWSQLKQQWFSRYCYPLSDDCYAMWSDEFDKWKPINHSCNPNAWLDGLNVVARYPIMAGEQITMDYATFCAENMETFKCNCGQVGYCRKLITGSDYLLPFMSDAYGNHVSDYIRIKREHRLKGNRTECYEG